MKQVSTFVLMLAVVLWGQSLTARGQMAPKAGTYQFPVAVGISLSQSNDCDVVSVCTGTAVVQLGNPHTNMPSPMIETEMLALNLTGNSAAGPIHVQQNPMYPTVGQIVGADSFFDVFVQICVNGQSMVNTQAITITLTNTPIPKYPPTSRTYISQHPVTLCEQSNTLQSAGILLSLWFHPSTIGKEAKLGLSLDVSGTNTLGQLQLTVYRTNSSPSAVANIRRETLQGAVTLNTPCNEVFDQLGQLVFEAVMDRDVRAPDWRGYHTGTCRLLEVSSNSTNVVATGKMAGTHGVGTHRKPPLHEDCEDCDECSHFEGKLSGTVTATGILRGAKIEATYAGEYVDAEGDPIPSCPLPSLPPHGPFRMAIDGVVVHR